MTSPGKQQTWVDRPYDIHLLHTVRSRRVVLRLLKPRTVAQHPPIPNPAPLVAGDGIERPLGTSPLSLHLRDRRRPEVHFLQRHVLPRLQLQVAAQRPVLKALEVRGRKLQLRKRRVRQVVVVLLLIITKPIIHPAVQREEKGVGIPGRIDAYPHVRGHVQILHEVPVVSPVVSAWVLYLVAKVFVRVVVPRRVVREGPCDLARVVDVLCASVGDVVDRGVVRRDRGDTEKPGDQDARQQSWL